MPLNVGSRLGPYEILAPLGAGGMGEVYRARDPRISRDVAIKVLPDAFALDADRLARFKREAQALGSLNHPHIATIYGVEETESASALILELVDGPTLADRIEQGPIPLDESLQIAGGIAEALDAAHAQGIIHRDLKPANIKLRKPDSSVKVLDFGLAKYAEEKTEGRPSDSKLPTITSPAMTMGGIVLGTAAYMSPEQARGKSVDKRTDIWAFGCVLFEMLAGKRAFEGDEVTDTLAAIIRAEPDWRALPSNTPPSIRRLLRRALEKNQSDRLADISDARLELRDAAEPTVLQPVTSQRFSWGESSIWLALASILALALTVTALRVDTTTRSQALYQVSILPPEGTTFGARGVSPAGFMALSPDGRHLVFVATDEGRRSMLWVRSLDSRGARVLPGTEGAREPFWSHDSREIAFIADGRLKRVHLSGGPVLTVTEPAAQGGSWSKENVILFAPSNTSPIHRVSLSGGPSIAVTALDAADGERTHDYPVFLPDGRHFLYLRVGTKANPNEARGVFATLMDAPNEMHRVLEAGSTMQYSSGHLLFLRGTTLMAHPFDLGRLQLTGDAAPIVEDVVTGGATGGGGAFSAALDGTMVVQQGVGGQETQIRWIDRTGKPVGVLGNSGDYVDAVLSADQRWAATALLNTQLKTRDIWLIDLVRNVPQRLTDNPMDEIRPTWSPDGKFIAFARLGNRGAEMQMTETSGTGSEELLEENATPLDWSKDGRFVLFLKRPDSGRVQADLWTFDLNQRKARAFLTTSAHENAGTFSPDARWVAYASLEMGTPEVYVTSFPSPGRRTRVSVNGGLNPVWNKDGKTLFYMSPDGRVVSAAVDGTQPEFGVGAISTLFEVDVRSVGRSLDVAGNGERFLVNSLLNDSFDQPLMLIVGWPRLLRPVN